MLADRRADRPVRPVARRPSATGGDAMSSPEVTGIVLRIAEDRTAEFEAMFAAEELPIWDDFTAQGLFLDAKLVKVRGGSEIKPGIQDYLLQIVAADTSAHSAHDADPRFQSFLAKALKMQPVEPLVWFGEPVCSRSSSG
jgi:hypothetical protein